ncbi:MAG: hypothetical protein J0M29_04345 [Chitinophagales bacterium]|nr:hypothetical protein [Chitinophagales bacterium]
MDFDALKDLVKTITRNKVKQIEVLGNPGEDGSMVEAFYDAISKDKVTSDEDAAKFLYGKNESPKSQAYLRLKGRLERNLINTAFFVDVNQPMFNERTKAYYNCYRDFAAANILFAREATRPGIDILEHLLEQTIKYEFTELTAEVASRLRREYSRVGSVALHERYAKIHREYEDKRRFEMLALEYFENLINYYIVRRSPNEEIHQLASTYYDELQPLADKADTCQYHFHSAQIGIIKYLSINDCGAALKICNDVLALLRKRSNASRGALIGASFQKIACLIQLRVFDGEAEEAIEFCLSIEEEGNFNWFRTHELYIHYCLFAKRYDEALSLFEKASTQPKFESLSGAVRDNWQLYGGYIHLLAALGVLPQDKVEKVVGTFRYAKLSNEIEVLTKDKQGMNIPLVLLPVIYNLVKGTFDASDISPESLEKYRKRYLDNDMNRRSAAFLNMLIAYAKRDYQSASAEKKIKKELEILEKEQPLVAGQTYAVEIIPYEDIWAMMTA